MLESLRRPDAEELIKRHGGRVTSAVSGKTSFLVVGRATGKSKFFQARAKNTKLIDEDGLFSLICASAPFIPPPSADDDVVVRLSNTTGGPSLSQLPSSVGGGGGHDAATAGKAAGAFSKGHSQGGARVPVAPVAPRAPLVAGDTQLWVEKFKPTSAAELVGNNALISVLRTWLNDWYVFGVF